MATASTDVAPRPAGLELSAMNASHGFSRFAGWALIQAS